MIRSISAAVAIAFLGVTLSAQAPKPAAAPKDGAPAKKSPGAGPVLVLETMKGTIQIETYPNEAPKSVAHILALAKRNFYNGQRIQRIIPGQAVQFGDPQTRDMTKREWWGRGFDSGSHQAIGVAEFSKKRLQQVGAVSLAHPGDPREADSQMFIALSMQPKWNGQYAVIGQVISGMDVVRKLQVEDRIVRVTIQE